MRVTASCRDDSVLPFVLPEPPLFGPAQSVGFQILDATANRVDGPGGPTRRVRLDRRGNDCQARKAGARVAVGVVQLFAQRLRTLRGDPRLPRHPANDSLAVVRGALRLRRRETRQTLAATARSVGFGPEVIWCRHATSLDAPGIEPARSLRRSWTVQDLS